jgi:50S ribosomal subunit-associated GTPase HflX
VVEGLDDAPEPVSDVPIDVIFVDHEISPSQARHLENEVGCQVMDRTMVILEIFHRNRAGIATATSKSRGQALPFAMLAELR